jgi:DNA-binding NarL/FixJ family response regulator
LKNELRILIADDHPIFRQGLRQVIERDPQLRVIAEASDGEAALEQLREQRPDIVVLDLDMPGQDGFAVARRIREEGLPARIVFLTMHKDKLHFNKALDLGVDGYVIKDSAAVDVVSCLKTVAAGEIYISPSLSSLLLQRRQRAEALQRQPGVADLTETERRILLLLADHQTSKQIAAELHLSVRTVENNRARICQKLDLHGSHALVKFAVEHKSELI